jgi:HD-GYP domain-containing protein (c-di-GMP phosphodiesterase class II)
MTSPLLGARVLVAGDDDRTGAPALVRRLERDGAVVRVTRRAADVRQLLADGPFDLVVGDAQQPEHDGLGMLEDARRVADPPVVLLLGSPGVPPTAADALDQGADGWLAAAPDAEVAAREAATLLELRALRRLVGATELVRAAGPTLVVLGEIVGAFEKADPYRAGFSARTARLVVALARPLGLDAERLALAARVHDVGMLAVPVTEQHADGPPDRTSQHLIRVHPTLGARWVERLGADRAIVAAIAAHHERYDGSGYPGGLAGEDIPPLARALGTAAAIAAMSLPRPWRPRMGPEAVIQELRDGQGTQFGPAEAEAALAALAAAPHLAT